MSLYACPKCDLTLRMEEKDFPLNCSCGSMWMEPGEMITKPDPDPPSLPKRIVHYAGAIAEHVLTGAKTRTDEEVSELLLICSKCEWFNGEICTHKDCGCRVNEDKSAWMNKLRMATQRCPIRKWLRKPLS